MSETAIHLGHHMSTKDKECTVNAAKNSFWRSFNWFISDYGHIYSFLKNELFRQYCCSYYGSPLCTLQSDGVESLCVAWRKALSIIWRVHPQTHFDVITALSGQKPLTLSLRASLLYSYGPLLIAQRDDPLRGCGSLDPSRTINLYVL